MIRVLAALAALLFLAGPAFADADAAAARLTTTHDAANGVWFMDKQGAGGAAATPTSVKANRFRAPFWTIRNHTSVNPVIVRVHGTWTPNYATPLDLTSTTEDYLEIHLIPGESFTMDRTRITLEGVTLVSTIGAGEYVLVMGWK